tara:strand:+ start:2942 stop:3193 length:252 start_codon:yes stop_codon:yes gene_type:complete
MNETQKAMARKVSNIISEHFGHGLVVLASNDMEREDYISLRFYGGALTAIGMAEYAKTSIADLLGDESANPEDLDGLDSKELG